MVSVASVMFRMWIQINPRASCSAPTTQATSLLALVTAGVMTRKGFAVFCRKHAQEDALSLGFDDMLYVKSCENESCSGRTSFISFRPPFRSILSSLQLRHSIYGPEIMSLPRNNLILFSYLRALLFLAGGKVHSLVLNQL